MFKKDEYTVSTPIFTPTIVSHLPSFDQSVLGGGDALGGGGKAGKAPSGLFGYGRLGIL
jgi:hypothetical protein